MPVMPASNTSQPLPLPSLQRIRQYRHPATPPGGEPVRPHPDSRIRDSRYAVTHVPESSTPGYDEGFSPELHSGTNTTPDDIRTKRREPPPHTNDPRFHKRRNADFLARRALHENETQNGWPIEQTRDPVPQSIPMSADVPAFRWTARIGQNTSWFTRDDYHRTPEFTGEHMSFEGHRRIYAVHGHRWYGSMWVYA